VVGEAAPVSAPMPPEPARDADLVRPLWWHVYGGITPEDHDWGGGLWVLTIFGENTKPPETMPPDGPFPYLSYLASFDHDPTDPEREALTPPDYQDEDPALIDGSPDA
jgi:hypothetical protein